MTTEVRAAPLSVNFGVVSLSRSLNQLGAELGIEATHAFNAGDEFLTRTGKHRRARSVWQVGSEVHVQSADVDEHVSWVLGTFEPIAERLQRYLRDPDFEVVIRFGLTCFDSIGGFSIAAEKLRRLTALVNRVDFSFIGEAADAADPISARQADSPNGPQRVV